MGEYCSIGTHFFRKKENMVGKLFLQRASARNDGASEESEVCGRGGGSGTRVLNCFVRFFFIISGRLEKRVSV